MSYLAFQAKVLHQSDVHGRRPSSSALQVQTVRLRFLVFGGQSEGLDSLINGLVGHGPVGGPLSTSDGHHATRRNVHNVVAGQGLRVRFIGVGDQGTDSTPRRQNITSAN